VGCRRTDFPAAAACLTLHPAAGKVPELIVAGLWAQERVLDEYMDNEEKARILVIDDDRFFRDLLRIHLTHAGYTVQVAEDAVEGGKALLQPDFDLVICDINMPYLTGFELVSLLRASKETASIPVIFASSRKDAETMMEMEKLGAAGYLAKPFQVEQLLQTVDLCLLKHKR
jgi:DNA-binding response OmpR family regulator